MNTIFNPYGKKNIIAHKHKHNDNKKKHNNSNNNKIIKNPKKQRQGNILPKNNNNIRIGFLKINGISTHDEDRISEVAEYFKNNKFTI